MMAEEKADFTKYDDEKNWARLVYIAKKHLDIWSHQNLRPVKGEMKLSYLPLIFNVNINGNTNAEISRKSLIAKQAMSRTVKELEEKGMITSHPLEYDKRSYQINLTDAGRDFVLDASQKMQGLIEDYKQLVGERDFEIAVEVLSKIIRYHEQKNTELGA